MIDTQGIMVFAKATVDRVAKFDWTKLIPAGTVDKYPYAVPPLAEFTWRQGLGLGIGVGKYDFWIGWPKDRQALQEIFEQTPDDTPRSEVLVGEIV